MTRILHKNRSQSPAALTADNGITGHAFLSPVGAARAGFSKKIGQDTDSFRIYSEIPPVSVRFTGTGKGRGRTETFNSAVALMTRLHFIGIKRQVILSLTEAGQPLPQHHVDALNHYLRACHGLRSFRRVCQTSVYSRFGWAELRGLLNIPTLAVLVSV